MRHNYSDDFLLCKQIFTSYEYFKSGEKDVNDDPKSEHSKTKLIKKVRKIIAILWAYCKK